MAFEDEYENEYENAERGWMAALSACAQDDDEPDDDALMRVALARDLLLAERLLARDPDAAALLLDGAPRRIVVSWLALRAAPAALGAAGAAAHEEPSADLLAQVERIAPAVAWRLRLALRAPHPEARLAHCWALLRAALASTPTPRSANLVHTRPARQGSARTQDTAWQAPA